MTRPQKAPLRPLSAEDRVELEQIARSRQERADRVARARVILAVADGAPFAEAARGVGRRSGDAVARLVARWNAEGIAAVHPRHGGGPPPRDPATPKPAQRLGRSSAPAILRAGELRRRLDHAMAISGAIAVALVDHHSGMVLDAINTGTLDLTIAAAGNSEVIRAKQRVLKDLNLDGEIEDILITLATQYHMIRPLERSPGLFFYLVLDREHSQLGLARRGLLQLEAGLTL
jgi:predicted regulator of Ras-like GTPase activity (Roadblock/LC7/MglB family)